MSARRLDLLEKLCVLLEGLPPEKFDYAHWANDVDVHACGTTACALGWATTIPECGLVLTHVRTVVPVVVRLHDQDEAHDSMDAASAAFGISLDEATALFDPGSWSRTLGGDDSEGYVYGPPCTASALDVAAWIRRHIEAWSAEQGAAS